MKNRRFLLLPLALSAAFLAPRVLMPAPSPAPSPAPVGPSVLRIETTKRQLVKGWGIYPCTIRNDRRDAALYTLWQRPNAQRLIFKELGATLIRSEILPGSYDARRDDGSLDVPYLDASLVRQLKLARRWGQTRYFLSVWSPPAPFKSPATTLGQDPVTRQPSRLRRDRETNYCRFIVRVLDHLTKKCALPVPLAFSFQNEPGYAADLWNGTAYDPAQWQRVATQMRRALDAGGYAKVQLIGPEGGSYGMSIEMLGGAGAPAWQSEPLRSSLDGLAFHGYTLFSTSRRAPYPDQLRAIALQAQKRGKDVWMSEWSIIAQKKTPLDHSLDVAQRLGREMAFVPSNYWCWWQGWYPRHPKGEVLLTGRDDSRLHISKTYFILQKLWHSAPPGSIVHRVQSSDPELRGFDADKVQVVAFATKTGQTLLLVNPTTRAKTIDLRGLTGRSAMRFTSDQTRDMAPSPLAIAQNAARFQIPPRSISVVTTQA